MIVRPADWLRLRDDVEADIHDARDEEERSKNFINALPKEKYQVIKPLGSGHSGWVFAAKQFSPDGGGEDGSEIEVAIKFLQSIDGGYIDRRTREFTAHRLLPPHENIVQLHSQDMLSTSGYEYFIMELCDMSLGTWMENQARDRRQKLREQPDIQFKPAIDPMTTVEMLYDLLSVLNILRQLGITHKDIRPENLLLKKRTEHRRTACCFDFQVKLADFGLSDIQVIEESVPYTNYFGVWTRPGEVSYDSDDDFRAMIASIFVAWVGEADSEDDARSAFENERHFEKIVAKLDDSVEDTELIEFFERALPMPRIIREGGAYSFEEAVRELEELGESFTGQRNWMKSRIHIFDKSRKDEEKLHNDKVAAYVNSSLSVISGRRYADDYATAERYLGWAQTLLKRFDGDPPAEIMVQFHLQWGLILCYRPLQTKVSEVVKTKASSGTEEEETSEYLQQTQDEIERLMKNLDYRLDLIKHYTKNLSYFGKLPPGLMLQTLGKVEQVKFYKSLSRFDDALRLSEKHIELLEATLSTLEVSAEVATHHLTPSDKRHRYQICRNTYLMIREAILLAQRRDTQAQKSSSHYKSLAVTICRKGHRFVRIDLGSNNSDRLEAGRCLCEALFINGSFDEAKKICLEMYREFIHDTTQKTRLIRVVAVWVASLRSLCRDSEGSNEELAFEFGYVCSLLTTMNREAAVLLLKQDKRSLSNAERFLAASTDAAIEAGSDQLVECPVIPDVDFVRDDACRALETLRAERQKSQ